MKKSIYLLGLIAIITLAACGSSEVESSGEQIPEVNLKGLEELSLKEYGYNLIVMVPKAEMNGMAEVTLTERGTLEIVIGLDYGIEITFEEGNIELLKMDLKEDLVFTSEILQEEKNALIYTQAIPDSGVKIQNHFMYRVEVGTEVYEVRDIMTKEYGLGMIEKMLESAKTIKASDSIKVAV